MEIQPPVKSTQNTTWDILIIDDDEDDYLLARDMLKEAKGRKYTVHWAPTFKKGREELRSDRYNAVLVDYDLGLHSGIDLIREANERGYPGPLILFTGRGNYEIDVEAMQAGATLYLAKGEANPLLLERVIRYAIELKQKEQALRDSEAALRLSEAKERAKAAEMDAILDAVPAIVWVTNDAQARKVTGNRVAHDFLRVPPDKNLSKSAPDEAPRNFQVFKNGKELAPDDLPLQLAAATGTPIRNFEEEVVFDDGSHAYLLGNVTPLLEEDGAPCGAVAAFIDITERKQMEETLSISEERFHKAFNANPNAQVISRLEDGRIEIINKSFEKLFGYHREEVIGKTSLELNMFANPADREEAVRRIRAKNNLRDFELDIRTKSGEIRQASLSVEMITIDNKPLMLTVIQDITERKKAEEALREMAKSLDIDRGRSAAVLDSLPVGVWIADQQGQLIGKNAQADRIWAGNAPLVESIDKYQTYTAWYADSGKLLLPEDYPVAKVLQTGQPVAPVELQIRRFDGTAGTILVSAAPIKDSGGTLLGAVGVNVDITERKHVEERLRASEERLAEFLDTTQDIFFALDQNWRFRYANPRFCEMLGRKPEEFIGKVYQEILPLNTGTIIEQHFRKALEEKVPVHFQINGAYTGRWFDVSVYPARDGILVFSRDRTEQHQAEEALREREEVLRLALDAAKAGVWAWDLTTHTMQWSGEYYRIFGFKPGSITPSAEAGLSHVHPDDRPFIEVVVQAALEHGKQVDEVHRVIWPDGSVHWVRGMSQAFYDAQGKPYRMAGIAIDVTQQKQAEETLAAYAEQLARSNQDLQNFAFIASHDLQEPLRKIVSFSDLLQQNLKCAVDEKSADILQRMKSAVLRMQEMINGLLDLSRVNTHGRPFEAVDLNQTAAEVISDLESLIERTQGQVLVDPLPTIQADPLQMYQLLQNLVMNALKFHKPEQPPRVRISAETLQPNDHPTPMVLLIVEDNGIGFDMQYFDRILEPFQRLNGRGEFDGTGMGLAICKRIVERHQGLIEAQSKPGEGTTFIVKLPKHQPG